MEMQKTEKQQTFIRLENVAKRFNYTWIFKGINLEIRKNEHLALLGLNGSGKSTLMQCIAGYQTISEGEWQYISDDKDISQKDYYQKIAIAAPYQDLIDDFTFAEMLDFHFSIKKKIAQISMNEIIELSGLKSVLNKKLLYFSSGMRQRVKLILAIFSDVEYLFLDEPCSNFDKAAIDWYNNLINKYAGDRGIIVCSNHQQFEYGFCKKIIEL
jgi:ABC-type multidrug transport system ATPase subunit